MIEWNEISNETSVMTEIEMKELEEQCQGCLIDTVLQYRSLYHASLGVDDKEILGEVPIHVLNILEMNLFDAYCGVRDMREQRTESEDYS